MLDRDFPDPRPVNPARDRVKIAEIMATVTTKEQALAQITRSQAAGLYEYKYMQPLHRQLVGQSTAKAKQFGATDEEISRAIQDGNIQGATKRQGFDNY